MGAIPVGADFAQRNSPTKVVSSLCATSQLQCWIGCGKEPISSMRPYNSMAGHRTKRGVDDIWLKEVMRSWGIRAREDLSDWLGQHCFPRSSPGSHVPARAQERLIHEASCRDARGVALFRARYQGHNKLFPESWEQLDPINMEELFLFECPCWKVALISSEDG